MGSLDISGPNNRQKVFIQVQNQVEPNSQFQHQRDFMSVDRKTWSIQTFSFDNIKGIYGL